MSRRPPRGRTAPSASLVGAGLVMALFAGAGSHIVSAAQETTTGSGGEVPSGASVDDIPDNYRQYYQQAADTCSGLDWATLAAVGKTETNHGRTDLPGVSSGENSAGAGGPMQFLASSYEGVQQRHPDVTGSRYNPQSAITATAHKLCDDGADQGNIRSAIYSYNHSSSYVNTVLSRAADYRAGT